MFIVRLFVLCIASSVFMACTTTGAKISDLNAEIVRLNDELEHSSYSTEETESKKKEILYQIKSLVDTESPSIAQRQVQFEKPISTTQASSDEELQDVTSVRLGQIHDRSDAIELYQRSMRYFNLGEYTRAAEGFLLAHQYASSLDLKARCLYWLGQCHYLKHDWERAIATFTKLEIEMPNHPLLVSALLKKGYSQLYSGDVARGKESLEMLMERYPTTNEASLAKVRLQEITQ